GEGWGPEEVGGGGGVTGHGIGQAGLDPALLEERGELGAPWRAHDVQVIDVACPGTLAWQLQRKPGEPRGVPRRELAPPLVHRVQATEQHAADGGLDVVEAEVETDLRVHVLVQPAVVAQTTASPGNLIVIRDHGSAVAHHGEILGWIEREHARAAEGPDLASVPAGAMGLRAILEHPEPVAIDQIAHGGDVDGL